MKLICNRFGTLLVVAGAMAFNGVAMGQNAKIGTVVAWGSTIWGATDVPIDLGPCKAIAAGNYHSLAIQISGTVIGWGYNNQGQIDIPTNLGPCKAIEAGVVHSLALTETGNIFAWGHNYYNQCNIPPNLGACIAIAAGDYHNLAIQQNGSVVAWGAGTTPGSGPSPQWGQSIIPENLGPCVAIAGGSIHSVALRQDGKVQAWGAYLYGETDTGKFGQCKAIAATGFGTAALNLNDEFKFTGKQSGAEIPPVNLGPCMAITLGGNYADFVVVIKKNGSVCAWGGPDSGTYGELNIPLNLGICKAISAGSYHTLAIQNPSSTITGVLPISGPSSGNTNITITGTNFESPATVTIGGAPATNVVVVSPTQITATTPAAFPGPAVVTVNLGSSTAFYYRPTCGADLDNNNVVDSADLGYLLLEYGNCSSESAAATESVEPVQIPMIEQTPLAAKK